MGGLADVDRSRGGFVGKGCDATSYPETRCSPIVCVCVCVEGGLGSVETGAKCVERGEFLECTRASRVFHPCAFTLKNRDCNFSCFNKNAKQAKIQRTENEGS